MLYFPQKWAETMPYCDISDRAQMSKTIIAVKHFALGGRESLETAVITKFQWNFFFWNLFRQIKLIDVINKNIYLECR